MFAKVLFLFVISLERTRSSQSSDNCLSGSQVCDSVNEPEAHGQINNVEYNSSKPDVIRSSTLSIKKRDVDINDDEYIPPLLLEPYLQKGNLMEARNKSEVKSDMFLGVKSYSGFLTVDKIFNSNLFFWYFPIENQKVKDNIWIIRLQGGQMLRGSSPCLDGVFEEVGPFKAGNNNFTHNPYSWHKLASLMFIDSLVGYGYSFTADSEGFVTDMAMLTLHLKLAIGQLLQLFPELKAAPLIISGESVAGKYAAALALELHNAKKEGLEINLQGVLTGNSFLKASLLTETNKAFHRFGLISKEDEMKIQPLVNKMAKAIAKNKSSSAFTKWITLYTKFQEMSKQSNANSILDIKLPNTYKPFITETWFKEAIHVGDAKIMFLNWDVDVKLADVFLTLAGPYYEELLNLDYFVITYCGMLDAIFPCYVESREHLMWRWHSNEEFTNATRSIYYDINGTRAGYYKDGGNLIEIQFRKAGHFVSRDNPQLLYDYVSLLTSPPLTAKQELEIEVLKRQELIKKIRGSGTPLMLTRYVDKGLFMRAKRLSKVESDMFLGVKSYSGFLTVNKTYNSNLFFWYFPNENYNASENVWVIWLNGRSRQLRGMSTSLDGAFKEVGPFSVRGKFLKRNPYSWHQSVSLVFIDNPVGSGYSFTEHPRGYVTDMDTHLLHLKLAVVQLLQIFPELLKAALVIAGESLGGKYAAALAMKLRDDVRKKNYGFKINLLGVITGNSFLEASMLVQTLNSSQDLGKITKEDDTKIKPLIDDFATDIKNNRSVAASYKWGRILHIILNKSGRLGNDNANNTLNKTTKVGKYDWLTKDDDFKKAIHVGNIEFSNKNWTVYNMFAKDFLTSAMPFYEQLLSMNYYVTTYCGMSDFIFSCNLASEQHRKWKWFYSDEFNNSKKYALARNKSEFGYFKSNGHLTEIEILQAGQFVSRNKPRHIYELVTYITSLHVSEAYQIQKEIDDSNAEFQKGMNYEWAITRKQKEAEARAIKQRRLQP